MQILDGGADTFRKIKGSFRADVIVAVLTAISLYRTTPD